MGSCENDDPGWGTPTVGAEPKHFDAIDENGDTFNLCEYAGERIVIDISADWCGPCIMWAEVSSGAVDVTDPALGVDAESQAFFLALRDAVVKGKIRWMTYLADPGTVEGASFWASQYPDERIPVFVPAAGEEAQLSAMLVTGGFPAFYFIDENFKWKSVGGWPDEMTGWGWI